MSGYIPTNSVEFETLTTEPTWGDEKDFDTHPLITKDDNLRKFPEYWRILGFFKRDLRLGNLSNMFDDFEWLEDRTTLTSNILSWRDGEFSNLAPVALSSVVSTTELSQSRNGFFRKNAKTAHISQEQKDVTEGSGFLNRLFGNKNKGGS